MFERGQLRLGQRFREADHLGAVVLSAIGMQIDTMSSSEMPGFVELGISPHFVETILKKMLSNRG